MVALLVCCVLWLIAFGIWLWMLIEHIRSDKLYHQYKTVFLGMGAWVLLASLVALLTNA